MQAFFCFSLRKIIFEKSDKVRIVESAINLKSLLTRSMLRALWLDLLGGLASNTFEGRIVYIKRIRRISFNVREKSKNKQYGTAAGLQS